MAARMIISSHSTNYYLAHITNC